MDGGRSEAEGKVHELSCENEMKKNKSFIGQYSVAVVAYYCCRCRDMKRSFQ